MARLANFGGLLLLAAVCFAAAVLAGSGGAKARAALDPEAAPLCCLYLIF